MQHVTSSRRRYEAFRRRFYERRKGSEGSAEGTADEQSPRRPREERRRYLRRYIDWLWPARFGVLLIVLLSLAIAGLEMIHPLFLRFIVDRVLLNEQATAADRMRQLHLAGAAFLAVIALGQVLSLSRNYRQRRLNVDVILRLRRALYDRMLHLPLADLAEMKTGGVISRLTGDVDTTTGMLQLALISPGVSLIRLVIAISILFALNWRLALTAVAVLPAVMLASFVVARRIRPIYRAVREDASQVDARVSETVGGIRVVRAFQRELRELLSYMIGRHTILRKELFAYRRELVLWSAWGFLMAGVNLVIVWYGGYLQIVQVATVGDIMAFQWYTLLLLTPVWQIVNSFSELQRSLAAMERVFEVLDMPADKPDAADAIAAPRRVEEIRFEDVSFEYLPGEPVVRDFEVQVPGGTVVALVGRSGAGKTTVTDLVARFHDPTRGQVLLNGIDIRRFRLNTYRELLGIVQQEVFLFDGSVAENIAYGRPHASREEVIEAARRAHAHEFIDRLPDGYDARIGERGVKLSGGQCQRLSIARAILADPQILILDEATSNLDTESEQLIQQSLQDLLHGRTTFVIAHRLSTIRHADLILVMDRGRIIERGTHKELLHRNGEYAQMVRRQQAASAMVDDHQFGVEL